jgi:hypothetical protein
MYKYILFFCLIALAGCSGVTGPLGVTDYAPPSRASDDSAIAFYGTVTDIMTNAPVENADIQIQTNTPWRGRAVTDENGEYVIYGEPKYFTEYLIFVSADGYIPMGTQAIGKFAAPMRLNCKLQPDSR